jgi:hypothetical protein
MCLELIPIHPDRPDPDPHAPDSDPNSDPEPAKLCGSYPIRSHNTGFYVELHALE